MSEFHRPVPASRRGERAEKMIADALEAERLATAAKKELSEFERNRDTRRKIIDGAHMQTEALTNPDIAALLHRRRDEKLYLDADRELFDLPPLDEAEKERRKLADDKRRKRKPQPEATLQEAGE
jgi:hypothetical protein